MFDNMLTVELEWLNEVLENAVCATQHRLCAGRDALAAELDDLQHEVWHVLCVRTGSRCFHHPCLDAQGHLVEVA